VVGYDRVTEGLCLNFLSESVQRNSKDINLSKDIFNDQEILNLSDIARKL
jgi:hypothetical protein